MAVTGKRMRYAMESYFMVPRRRIAGLVPEGLEPYTKFGMGEVAVGAWNHTDCYVDDRSYGPMLEAWVAVMVKRGGVTYAHLPFSYNNNPSYTVPVNDIFKFSKLPADIEWRVARGRHELEARIDGRPLIRMSGCPTFVPRSIPFSRPRLCWLIKSDGRYVARMTISARRSRLAFCSVDIPGESPLSVVADAIRRALRYSVFYEEATVEIPEPELVAG
jgi:hypothetical protein